MFLFCDICVLVESHGIGLVLCCLEGMHLMKIGYLRCFLRFINLAINVNSVINIISFLDYTMLHVQRRPVSVRSCILQHSKYLE